MKKVTIGIHTKIDIYCEDENQILVHLAAIRTQVKKVIKKQGEIKSKVKFEDDNCYGTHFVTIKPDMK